MRSAFLKLVHKMNATKKRKNSDCNHVEMVDINLSFVSRWVGEYKMSVNYINNK